MNIVDTFGFNQDGLRLYVLLPLKQNESLKPRGFPLIWRARYRLAALRLSENPITEEPGEERSVIGGNI